MSHKSGNKSLLTPCLPRFRCSRLCFTHYLNFGFAFSFGLGLSLGLYFGLILGLALDFTIWFRFGLAFRFGFGLTFLFGRNYLEGRRTQIVNFTIGTIWLDRFAYGLAKTCISEKNFGLLTNKLMINSLFAPMLSGQPGF